MMCLGLKMKPSFNDFLTVSNALYDAEVPLDRRMMYYFKISWWRHPLKRYKQKKQLRDLLVTTDDNS
jgi:hypothetical protein